MISMTMRQMAIAGVCLGLTTSAAAQTSPHAPGVSNLQRGRIGIQIQPMTPELREHFHAPRDRGLLVNHVDSGGPGAAAGIAVGDILLEGNGRPLTRPYDLVRIVSRVPEGENVELVAVRDGKQVTFTVRPQGEAMPWLDPESWSEWAEEGMRKGREGLRHHLRELDRRLEELQRRLEKLEEKGAEPGEPT